MRYALILFAKDQNHSSLPNMVLGNLLKRFRSQTSMVKSTRWLLGNPSNSQSFVSQVHPVLLVENICQHWQSLLSQHLHAFSMSLSIRFNLTRKRTCGLLHSKHAMRSMFTMLMENCRGIFKLKQQLMWLSLMHIAPLSTMVPLMTNMVLDMPGPNQNNTFYEMLSSLYFRDSSPRSLQRMHRDVI